MSNIAQNDEDEEAFAKIKKGFRVNHMQMKNGENGEVMWEVKSWDLTKEHHTENITKELLEM